MKVLQIPHHSQVKGNNGIEQVVLHYGKYLPEFGVELMPHNSVNYDVLAVHAGTSPHQEGVPMVAHNHGLHWSAEHESMPHSFWGVNAQVIDSIRHAQVVTVPSEWVAEPFRRDMHLDPFVVPHGVEWDEWQQEVESGGYVLWNKNRVSPACDPTVMQRLATVFQDVMFLTTFGKEADNVKVLGTKPHPEMKMIVKRAGVYLSTAKETFGIGTLEAMASGVPVLGWAYGGNLDIVEHGVTGYLAEPGNFEDLADGLSYCLQYGRVLGENGREIAKRFDWRSVCDLVSSVYEIALDQSREPPTTCFVIPTFNYANQVGRAIESALSQTVSYLAAVIVVDDGSTDDTADRVNKLIEKHKDHRVKVIYHRKENGGVATARNEGIRIAIDQFSAKYICCLDADDAVTSEFLSKTVPHLEKDSSLGIAYTGLTLMLPDGRRGRGRWPGQCDFNAQVQGRNQVPTCCVFRSECWQRLGGFRQRYAPRGAGAEDAEFWLRIGASGWSIRQVTAEPLFIYTYGVGATTGDPEYHEPDWLGWHPWTSDNQHPFASIASSENGSHPVRSYSEPKISFVVPVGPDHTDKVWNAMDSIEAQTFRDWEVIVVFDTGNDIGEGVDEFIQAFPFARFLSTTEWKEGQKPKGAGYARNRGAEKARSPFLVFLDADDWLYPNYVEEVLRAWDEHESIIYTDYVGRAIIDRDTAEEYYKTGRLYNWNPDTQEGVIGANKETPSFYDCELAQRQPEYTGDPNAPVYHWCLVTCLIPRAWHEEIGGFDEQLPTWEDVLYHWAMARHGKCYTHLLNELLVYNFHHGTRREAGLTRQTFENVIQYISKRLEGIETMACKGCGGKASANATRGPVYNVMSRSTNPFLESPRQGAGPAVMDTDMVLVVYNSPKRGTHPVYGVTMDPQTGLNRFYGMRAGGDQFLVHKQDIWDEYGNHVARHFQPVEQPIRAVAPRAAQVFQKTKPTIRSPSTPPPTLLTEDREAVREEAAQISTATSEGVPMPSGETTIDSLPGVTTEIAEQLAQRGWTTYQAIVDAGSEQLQTLKGVGPMRAEALIDFCMMVLEPEEQTT